MSDPGAIVVIVLAGCTASVFVAKVIATAVLRYQENELGAKGQPVSEARLQRMEHALDSIAIEIERISASQRFTTKLLSDGPAKLKQPDDLA